MKIKTVAVAGLTTAYTALNVVTGGAPIIAGATKGLGAGVLGSIGNAFGFPERQSGGYIPRTGLYMLHTGETVVPHGKGIGTNIININMQSGPISNNVDVSNMLDAMASRMTFESRRRTGR